MAPAKRTATKETAAKKTSAKPAAKPPSADKPPSRRSVSLPKSGKDPKGGLTAEGRRIYNEATGGHLKPGVQGKADTPEKMLRKGSFLRRHFAHPQGPVVDEKGQPTRQALEAAAWGEPVPASEADEKKLAKRGTDLLEQYHGQRRGENTERPMEACAEAERGRDEEDGERCEGGDRARRQESFKVELNSFRADRATAAQVRSFIRTVGVDPRIVRESLRQVS